MNIKEGIALKDYSTYKIGGRASYFCEAADGGDLHQALLFAKERGLQLLFLMGGGSNLIIHDKGFAGLVVKMVDTHYEQQGMRVDAGAGISLAEVVARTTQAGLKGVEWAGGLPGSLGGAIFGNAGAFGGEMKDVVRSVKAAHIMDYQAEIKDYSKEECQFSYRNSKFKREGNFLILSAVMEFTQGNAQELQKITQEKMNYRKNRHPLEYPNIGSIFKNIDEPEKIKSILEKFPELEADVKGKWHGKVPTAALVQKAGLQGKKIGGAMISNKHANFIINHENAKASDVVSLINDVKATIKEKFGIELEEEVRYVGF